MSSEHTFSVWAMLKPLLVMMLITGLAIGGGIYVGQQVLESQRVVVEEIPATEEEVLELVVEEPHWLPIVTEVADGMATPGIVDMGRAPSIALEERTYILDSAFVAHLLAQEEELYSTKAIPHPSDAHIVFVTTVTVTQEESIPWTLRNTLYAYHVLEGKWEALLQAEEVYAWEFLYRDGPLLVVAYQTLDLAADECYDPLIEGRGFLSLDLTAATLQWTTHLPGTSLVARAKALQQECYLRMGEEESAVEMEQ